MAQKKEVVRLGLTLLSLETSEALGGEEAADRRLGPSLNVESSRQFER